MRAERWGIWASRRPRAAAAAPRTRSGRLPGAACAGGARLPPSAPRLPPPARPQPARARRPHPQRSPLPPGLALPWAPALRSHPASPNLALSAARRKLREAKWEPTVKGRPSVRSRYSPSRASAFATRAAHPAPHLCSPQSAAHHASQINLAHAQGTLDAPGPPPVTSPRLLHL